jgi:uncharacterized protein YndB with AHSA1/START domain
MTIRKEIRVERSPQICFKVFCDEMDQWWPWGFSGEGSRVRIDSQIGGRFYEVKADGGQFEIGRVTSYEPPRLIGFSFRAPDWEATTQVEVRFIPDGSGTRIELEHSGWEKVAQAESLRKGYEDGWGEILGHFQTRAASGA